jgi:TP901 family phage tail tape measure protein
MSDLKGKQSQFREELGLTSRALNETSNSTKGLMGGIKESMGGVAGGILAAFSIKGAVDLFVGAIGNAFEISKKFEQGIADLSAITGATGADLEYYSKKAIEVGATTKGGANAVVEAYKLIGSAKPELLENAEALNAVTESAITLAKASGLELPEAATALTDAMNQFGAGAEKANSFIDALANGAKFGAAEIPQVTESLLKFGAVASSSNISVEESVGLIELLAEKGLKGAEAGTALRNVLLKIAAPDALPKDAIKAMEALGINVEKLSDKSLPVQERLAILKPLLSDTAAVVKVFGTENAVAATNILANTERLGELTSKMGEVGTAQEQAAVKMDTVENKTELLKSKYV